MNIHRFGIAQAFYVYPTGDFGTQDYIQIDSPHTVGWSQLNTISPIKE